MLRIVSVLVPALLGAQPLDRAALVKSTCAGCHSNAAKSGGLSLEGVSPDTPGARPDIWERVARRVKAGEMPPPGAPNPGSATLNAFSTALLKELDAAAKQKPYAGKPVIQRLNRTEYSNAIRDLLAIDLPLAAELPQDGIAGGFDNIADALSMSPLLLEQYLKVGRRVTELAAGVRDASTVTEVYPAKGSQAAWQEGMPFGTRGGIKVKHYFSHDGEYDLRAFLGKDSLTPTPGVRFFTTRVKLKAGSHNVIVTFPDEFAAREGPVSDVSGQGGAALGGPLDILGTAIRPTLDFRVDGRRVKLFEIAGMTSGEAAFDGLPGPPILNRIEIAGPFHASGVSDTPSRQRIFVCRGSGASEEPACAARILTAITRRAFRRDVTSADLQPYLKTYAVNRQKKSFDESIAAAIRDVLLAPDFLFRLEFDPTGAALGSVHPVNEFALASRLSFFLWSTIPDDALLDTASAGKLRGSLNTEIQRMLADPRAEALADNFAAQWLGLRGLHDVEPDRTLFPDYDTALVASMQSETQMFVRSLIRENRSIYDLLSADYTYLNDRLARLYGIDSVTGPAFRRVALKGNQQRGGLLGHGSVMLMTSHAARTSPVLRGKWILNNLLNSPPPAPPANVPPLEATATAGRKLTTREQTELHRQNPACMSCHIRIDALGFALENYDVLGRWRTEDAGGPIDPSGKLMNGKTFSGPQGLKGLLTGSDEFARGTVEKLMTYALGRELDARDQPTVRGILRSTAANRYRFGDLIEAIAKSVPFQMRQTQER